MARIMGWTWRESLELCVYDVQVVVKKVGRGVVLLGVGVARRARWSSSDGTVPCLKGYQSMFVCGCEHCISRPVCFSIGDVHHYEGIRRSVVGPALLRGAQAWDPGGEDHLLSSRARTSLGEVCGGRAVPVGKYRAPHGDQRSKVLGGSFVRGRSVRAGGPCTFSSQARASP